MKFKLKISLFLLIGFLITQENLAQETPQELGLEFLFILKSPDTAKINNLIPNPNTLIEFSKNWGIERTKEDIADFLNAYPNEVKQFKNRFQLLRSNGIEMGIDWQSVEFIKVNISSREQKINEAEKPILVTDLTVVFKSKSDVYNLNLNSIFEFENRWYLAGDKPELEKY